MISALHFGGRYDYNNKSGAPDPDSREARKRRFNDRLAELFHHMVNHPNDTFKARTGKGSGDTLFEIYPNGDYKKPHRDFY